MINELLLIIMVSLHGWVVYELLKFKARILQFKGSLLSLIPSKMEVDELVDKLICEEEAAARPAPSVLQTASQRMVASDAAGVVAQKRERLAAVIAGGQSQRYLGRALSLDQVEKLADSEITKLYARYEMLFGASMAKSLGHYVLTMYSDLVAYFRPKINPVSLTSDLENDPVVELGLSAYSGSLYHRFGQFLTPIVMGHITIKHCKFGEDNGGGDTTNSEDARRDAPSQES